jgi:hypothetical protein
MSKALKDLPLLEEESTERAKPQKLSNSDSILDAFIVTNDAAVEVIVEGQDPKYLRSQLDRRIKARYLEDFIEVSVVDRKLYLKKGI